MILHFTCTLKKVIDVKHKLHWKHFALPLVQKLIGVNQWVFGFLRGRCHRGDHLSLFVGFKKEFQFVT